MVGSIIGVGCANQIDERALRDFGRGLGQLPRCSRCCSFSPLSASAPRSAACGFQLFILTNGPKFCPLFSTRTQEAALADSDRSQLRNPGAYISCGSLPWFSVSSALRRDGRMAAHQIFTSGSPMGYRITRGGGPRWWLVQSGCTSGRPCWLRMVIENTDVSFTSPRATLLPPWPIRGAAYFHLFSGRGALRTWHRTTEKGHGADHADPDWTRGADGVCAEHAVTAKDVQRVCCVFAGSRRGDQTRQCGSECRDGRDAERR